MEAYYSSDDDVSWGPVTLREVKRRLKQGVQAERRVDARRTVAYNSPPVKKESDSIQIEHMESLISDMSKLSAHQYFTAEETSFTDKVASVLEDNAAGSGGPLEEDMDDTFKTCSATGDLKPEDDELLRNLQSSIKGIINTKELTTAPPDGDFIDSSGDFAPKNDPGINSKNILNSKGNLGRSNLLINDESILTPKAAAPVNSSRSRKSPPEVFLFNDSPKDTCDLSELSKCVRESKMLDNFQVKNILNSKGNLGRSYPLINDESILTPKAAGPVNSSRTRKSPPEVFLFNDSPKDTCDLSKLSKCVRESKMLDNFQVTLLDSFSEDEGMTQTLGNIIEKLDEDLQMEELDGLGKFNESDFEESPELNDSFGVLRRKVEGMNRISENLDGRIDDLNENQKELKELYVDAHNASHEETLDEECILISSEDEEEILKRNADSSILRFAGVQEKYEDITAVSDTGEGIDEEDEIQRENHNEIKFTLGTDENETFEETEEEIEVPSLGVLSVQHRDHRGIDFDGTSGARENVIELSDESFEQGDLKNLPNESLEFNDTLAEIERALKEGLDYSMSTEVAMKSPAREIFGRDKENYEKKSVELYDPYETSTEFSEDASGWTKYHPKELRSDVFENENIFTPREIPKIRIISANASNTYSPLRQKNTPSPVPTKLQKGLKSVDQIQPVRSNSYNNVISPVSAYIHSGFKIPKPAKLVSAKKRPQTPANFQHVRSPVAVYIKNTPTAPLLQNVHREQKVTSIPKSNSNAVIQTRKPIQIPAAIYKPANKKVHSNEKEIVLPGSIKNSVQQCKLTKHEQRFTSRKFRNVSARLAENDLTVNATVDGSLLDPSNQDISVLKSKNLLIE